MPNRHANTGDYRYGFQGQEMDNEIKGEGNSLNYTFRMHDPRVGRFFAIDPLTKKYPWYTPYSFGGNKVIAYTELEGEEEVGYVEKLDYNGDAFDYLIAVPNAAISINNSVNVIWNSGVATVKKLYHDGIFGYGKALAEEVVATGEGISDSTGKLYDYSVNTPAKQQLKDFGDKISSPEFFEGTLAFAGEAYMGTKVSSVTKLPVARNAPVVSTIDDVVEGGAYGRMKNVINGSGKNITEKNHLPTKQAFKLSELKISDYMGSANLMDKLDHRSFISTGSSKAAQAFRQLEAKLLGEGKYLEAFDLNAKKIRKQFGNKYDKGLKQARKHFEEEVIPVLKEQK